MKTIASILCVLFNFFVLQAQITPIYSDTIEEVQQANPSFVCLEGYGIKRLKVSIDNQMIYLYNLNNSIFRQFPIPSVPWSPILYANQLNFFSTNLFDTNATDIEFEIHSNAPDRSMRIYREDGSMLMDFPDGIFHYAQGTDLNATHFYGYPILTTDSGSIMRVTIFDGNTPIRNDYLSLPGRFPNCNLQDGGEVSGISGTPLRPAGDLIFPNPVFSGQKVTYRMGQDYAHGKLMFFDNSGKKVHHVTLSDSETDIFLERTIFPAGTYYYQFYSENEAIGAKQLIVVN